MKRSTALWLAVTGLVLWMAGSVTSFAQLSQGGQPCLTPTELRQVGEGAFMQLTPPDEGVIARALSQPADTPLRPFEIGVPIAIELDARDAGETSFAADGTLVWRIRLASPGAKTLALHCSLFQLPEGGRLFLLDDQGKVLAGAFTAQNNHEKGLAIAPTPGESVTLHYEAPTGDSSLPHLRIDEITYGFRTLGERPQPGYYEPGEPWFTTPYPCTKHPVSIPLIDEISRASVLLITAGRTVFSGVLLNNLAGDKTPYILTASHCFNRNFQEPGNLSRAQQRAAQTVVFFNFRSPLGNEDVRGVEEQTLAGLEIVAINETNDLCLARITGVDTEKYPHTGGIPPAYMPYFAGWNAEPQPQGPFTGLHYPKASVERYNRCDQTQLAITDFDAGVVRWIGQHLFIPHWTVGTTDGGSSGSPLFDAQQRVIGALSGGKSTCERPVADAYYALSKVYYIEGATALQHLSPWLDPQRTGRRSVAGLDPLAPTAPFRLSHNIHSPHRDVTELQPAKQGSIIGVGNHYVAPRSMQLLGLYCTASWAKEDSYELLLYRRKKGESAWQEMLREPLALPSFLSGKNAPAFEKRERTLLGKIEFFISLEHATLTLQKGEELAVLIASASGTPLAIQLLRSAAGEKQAQHALVLTTTQGGPISATDPHIPATEQYHGSYWLDPICLPLEAGEETQEKPQNPILIIGSHTMRVICPPGEEPVSIALHSLEGHLLQECKLTAGGTVEILLSPIVQNTRTLVAMVCYKKKKYSTLVIH